MTYKNIIVPKRGTSEVLEIKENEMRFPLSGEVRIRVLAAGVCQDDIAARVGNRPFLPKLPFVPGYTIQGDIDAVGDGVTSIKKGDRVAALTVLGGYTEYIYLAEEKLIQVPLDLNPAEAVTLILNYLTAYQALHRCAKVKTGDKMLVIGASGGVGTAFLQLGKLAELKMYGIASPSKHSVLKDLGAYPIDYHTQDFVEVLRQVEPDGLDFVFNGMSGEYLKRGFSVLQRGGTLVHYGAPESFSQFLHLMAEFLFFMVLPNGKKIKGYGTHRVKDNLIREDWEKLFTLLQEDKIKPIIAAKFPILEAAKANDLLESGQVIGNVVLVTPEFL